MAAVLDQTLDIKTVIDLLEDPGGNFDAADHSFAAGGDQRAGPSIRRDEVFRGNVFRSDVFGEGEFDEGLSGVGHG